MSDRIAVAQAIAALAPELLDSCTDAELAAAVFDPGLLLRPEQRIPAGTWRSFGIIAGRGWGKTTSYGPEFNRRVQSGDCRAPALMAPTEDRIIDVQVAAIVDASPPWFRAEEYHGTVRWPNGVVAEAFTPTGASARSGNFDLTWLTEIVDWHGSGRLEAYRDLATATRVRAAQILWDTTSKGQNEVIGELLANHRRDPGLNILRRGTTFDNPILPKTYLREVCRQYWPRESRRYREEILGEVFEESAGALWQYAWISDNRVHVLPSAPALTVVGLDPALSARHDADETGIAVASRTADREIYLTKDRSGHYTPDQWGEIVVEEYLAGAAGAIVERNHAGDLPETIIRAAARKRGVEVRLIADDGKPFPTRLRGTLYLRGTTSTRSKESRAGGPASLYSQGRVHHVGVFDALELEQTSWEPGSRKSPNRLDAAVFAIGELAELRWEGRRDARPDVRGAAVAQAELRRLPTAGGRGRLGR